MEVSSRVNVALALMVALVIRTAWSQGTGSTQCVPVHSPECTVFYNETVITSNSSDRAVDLINLKTLYTTANCSVFTHFFICAGTFPRCIDDLYERKPCKDLCVRVRQDCDAFRSVLDTVPGSLFNCDIYSVGGTCFTVQDALATVRSTQPPPSTTTSPGSVRFNRTCPLGDSAFFTESAKKFATGWIATWATLCFISTLATLLTFIIDRSRFEYPWRPIIYVALCYNIHAFGYYLSLIIGNETVTCPNDEIVRTRDEWSWAHTPCILVFIILYYTLIAVTLWWLVLTLNWFLATALKWSNEAIGRLAPFYHLTAWLFPLLMTIIILSVRLPAADELSGICFIVRDDTDASFVALLLTVIIPLTLILATGIFFIVIGFIDVLKIRSFVKQSGRETTDLEKLMFRIGVFVVVYIVPALIVISCFAYELDSRPNWRRVSQTTTDCPDCSEPNAAVFMCRVFFILVIGILSGIWIWSKKTVQSWRSAILSLRRRPSSPVQYGVNPEYSVSAEVEKQPSTLSYEHPDTPI